MGLYQDWRKQLPSHGITTAMDHGQMIEALVKVLDEHLTPPKSGVLFVKEELIRASGDVICEECGDTYRHHPHDMKQLDSNGEPWLRVRCDGQRLKL